jgi:hypothetical protein
MQNTTAANAKRGGFYRRACTVRFSKKKPMQGTPPADAHCRFPALGASKRFFQKSFY